MKNLLLALTLLSSVATLAKSSFKVDDLVGAYSVSGVDVPYSATVTLSKKMGLPVVEFVEEGETDFSCKGVYSVSYGNQVDLSMYCGDLTFAEAYQKLMNDVEPDFTQNINLENVTAAQANSSFVAPVKSSLFDNIPFKFKFTKK
mgnify:CR=1 FL=1